MWKWKRNRNSPDFKPDAQPSTLLKVLHMSQLQHLRLRKWALYCLVILLAQVIQDVIMSQVRIFGATTDLVVCVILLITVIEGTEVGSLFVLIASTCYYFSGTAPGAYCIGLMTALGIAATLLRQMYLHRGRGSIVACAGLALIIYELGLYASALFEHLTRWDRLGVFFLTGVYSALLMIPLYPYIEKIGLIGGKTWKE